MSRHHAKPRTPRLRLIFLSLVLSAFIGQAAMPVSAAAEALLMPRSQLVEMLDRRYRERPLANGLDSGGGLIEIFASPGGATWTMVRTSPKGLSRIIGTGENWDERLPRRTDRLL